MALQRSADNGVHNNSYESAKHGESGIELADVSTGIYDTLEHRDRDSRTYGDVTTAAAKTKSGTNNNTRKGDFNNAATVNISGVNVERAIYKVLVGLLLFSTLLCTLSGVIVYHVISAKLSDNDSKTSQHQDVAPKTNVTEILAMEIKYIKAEFTQFNNVWKEQMSDNLSESRDYLTSINKRLETLDNVVQTVRTNQSESDTTLRDYHVSIDRRLEELDNDVQAVQDKQNSSGYFTETGGWELIFRATAGNGDNVYDAWTTGKNTTDVKPSSMARGMSRHYRNTQNITEWSNVQMVKYSLFENSREVAFIIFNGIGSTKMDWFALNRVLDSSWSAIASKSGVYNYFSIVGHVLIRRFFVSVKYGGCSGDVGYTVVSDTRPTKAGCPYETHSAYPQFMYSIFDGSIYWHNLMYGKADYMAVFYRHN